MPDVASQLTIVPDVPAGPDGKWPAFYDVVEVSAFAQPRAVRLDGDRNSTIKLSESRDGFRQAWWPAGLPGLASGWPVVGINLLGDAGLNRRR